jgi:peptidoglycan/LPS O-acetylase OafA/YrhL
LSVLERKPSRAVTIPTREPPLEPREVSPVPPEPSAGRSRRRADIQGLRAIAVLLVVAFHAGLPVPGGFIGVDVFFVISGFVITGSLHSQLVETGSISLRGFYGARVRRLLPALAVMLVFVAVAALLASPFGAQRMAALTTGAAALFTANFYLLGLGTGYFDVQTTLNPQLHTWTLAVEEQFYVVFPCALALAWRFGRRRAIIATISVITVASFLLSLRLSAGDEAVGRIAFYSSPTRAWEFGLGALLALAPLSARRLPAPVGALLGVGGIALIDFGATSLHGTDGFPGTQALFPVVGAFLLIAGGANPAALTSRLLAIRPLVAIGDLSYSWYLWHWPLIVFAVALLPGAGWAAPTAAAASTVPAYLSYRLLENPIRRRRRLRRVPALALAGACVVIPLLAAGGLAARHAALGHNPKFAALEESQLLHADVVRGCDRREALDVRTGSACTWAVASPLGTVVLIGDSNAGHFTEPVAAAANRLGYDATVATLSSCPFTLVRMRYDGAIRDTAGCPHFVAGTLLALTRSKPSLVIIASRTDDYIRSGNIALGSVGDASLSRDGYAKAASYRQGLEGVIRRLNANGVPVVIVHPVPRLPFDPAGCAVSRVLSGSCFGTRSRQAVDAESHDAIATENRAIASATGAWAIGFENDLCDKRFCHTSKYGVAMYRNSEHLSVAGALTLTDRFANVITAHARA